MLRFAQQKKVANYVLVGLGDIGQNLHTSQYTPGRGLRRQTTLKKGAKPVVLATTTDTIQRLDFLKELGGLFSIYNRNLRGEGGFYSWPL